MSRRKRPPRGRPPRTDRAAVATERIEIRVTKLERATMRLRAAQAGISVTEWILKLVAAEEERLSAGWRAALEVTPIDPDRFPKRKIG